MTPDCSEESRLLLRRLQRSELWLLLIRLEERLLSLSSLSSMCHEMPPMKSLNSSAASAGGGSDFSRSCDGLLLTLRSSSLIAAELI